MTEPTKPSRGGKREPLPRFDIHIPTWTKYQQGQAQRYVRVERGARHNRQLNAIPLQYRWVWLALVLSVDADGWLRNVTVKDVAFEAGTSDLRSIRSAIATLQSEGLISCTGDAPPKQEQSTTKAGAKHHQSTTEAKRFALSRNDAGYSATEQNREEQNRTDKNIVPDGPTAGAEAPARKVDWTEQLAKATGWLAETLPELADDLIGFFSATIPASSNPAQYVAGRIAEVKSQAAPRKGPAPPRDVLVDAWRQTIRKGAGAAYAAKIIENRVQEAFSGRTAGANGADRLGRTAPNPPSGSRREPGQIWDVKL